MTIRFFAISCLTLFAAFVCQAQDKTCLNDPMLLRDKDTNKPILHTGEQLRKALIRHERPKFPAMCRCQGNVGVRILVNDKGEVACADVISGHPLFHLPVTEAVKKWRFEPTVIEGETYAIAGLIFFNFGSEGTVSDNVLREQQYCQIQTKGFSKYSIYPDELSPEETEKRALYRVPISCPPNSQCDPREIVRIFVTPAGKVECVTLPVQAHASLKAVLGETVRQWKFAPLKVKGKAVYFNGQLSIPIKMQ